MVDYITHVAGMLKRRWSNEFHEENSRTYLFKYKFRLVFRRRSRRFGLSANLVLSRSLWQQFISCHNLIHGQKSRRSARLRFLSNYIIDSRMFSLFSLLQLPFFEIFSYWLIQLLCKLLLIKTAFLVAINIARLPTHAKNTATIGN